MRFKIFYLMHVYNAAHHLMEQLNKLGHSAELTKSIDSNDAAHVYIIYCAFTRNSFPPKYIVYQTEVPGSKWWSNAYYNTLSNAIAVWDYSAGNICSYAERLPSGLPVHCVTPGIWSQPYLPRKDIPILFYGSLNERRIKLLGAVKKKFNVTMVDNQYGPAMFGLLARARIVLNIHYYPSAPLETFRVNEALSFGCHVVSEPADGMDRYKQLVSFADGIAEFNSCIYQAVVSPFNYDLNALDNKSELEAAVASIPLNPKTVNCQL